MHARAASTAGTAAAIEHGAVASVQRAVVLAAAQAEFGASLGAAEAVMVLELAIGALTAAAVVQLELGDTRGAVVDATARGDAGSVFAAPSVIGTGGTSSCAARPIAVRAREPSPRSPWTTLGSSK